MQYCKAMRIFSNHSQKIPKDCYTIFQIDDLTIHHMKGNLLCFYSNGLSGGTGMWLKVALLPFWISKYLLNGCKKG